MTGFIEVFDTARDYTLQFGVAHTHTHTSVHSHVITSRCSVAASNGGRSLSPGFQNCPRASATSFSQQHLATTEAQQSSN
jgi:hypothetical protein